MFLWYFFFSILVVVSSTKECGHTFHSRKGNFSPFVNHLLNNQSSDIKCMWRISARKDEKILLNINNMNIDKSPGCTSGYIEIRDGLWYNSRFIGKFCGSGHLNSVTSTGNKMLVTYINKSPNNFQGFSANYEAMCGEELFIDGTYLLESPKEGKYYPLSKKCIWNVVVPENHQVVVNFQKIQIEYHKNCLYDYVKVRDGTESNSTSFGTFCGETIPNEIVSSSNNIQIEFVSDESVQKEGFLVSIVSEYDECTTAEHGCAHGCLNTVGSYICTCRSGYTLQMDGKNCDCGSTLYAENGTIKSPDNYPENQTCIWQIVTPNRKVATLNFTHFDVGYANSTKKQKCENDKLEIYGTKGVRTKRYGVYCGENIPEPIVSNSERVYINLTSDSDKQNTGFVLEYSTVADKCELYNGNCFHECLNTASGYHKCVCSEGYQLENNNNDCRKNDTLYEISSTFGYISVRNQRPEYFQLITYEWKFKTTPGHKINLEFLEYNLDPGNDYVTIYDGPTTLSKQYEGRYQSKPSNPFLSSTNQLYMTFNTYSGRPYTNFHVKYSSKCGGTLQASTEERYIFSHATYGSSNYENNSTCQWTIQADPQYTLHLTIETLEMEDSADCECDFVEIFEDDVSAGKLCGTKSSQVFWADNHFLIKFQSDGSFTDKGFFLKYKAILPLPPLPPFRYDLTTEDYII